jgi:hypothetical protein
MEQLKKLQKLNAPEPPAALKRAASKKPSLESTMVIPDSPDKTDDKHEDMTFA